VAPPPIRRLASREPVATANVSVDRAITVREAESGHPGQSPAVS
jgi:hypothetical protein